MQRPVILIDDPQRPDVRGLLDAHLRFARQHTPPEHVNALGHDRLLDPAITLFSLRLDGALYGIGALKQLDSEHVEIKSMHTVATARRSGVGRAILHHLLAVARERGARRVSLETGTMEAFAPARAMYAAAGFEPCEPFGDYGPTPSNTFMTLYLD